MAAFLPLLAQAADHDAAGDDGHGAQDDHGRDVGKEFADGLDGTDLPVIDRLVADVLVGVGLPHENVGHEASSGGNGGL